MVFDQVFNQPLKVAAAFKRGSWYYAIVLTSCVIAYATLKYRIIKPFSIAPESASAPLAEAEKLSQGISLNDAATAQILERNLFNKTGELGDSSPADEQGNIDQSVVAKTSLPLELMGIIYGGTPFTGLASIKMKDKNVISSYLVGDVVGRAEVVEIHREKVFIRNSGRIEYIEMPPMKELNQARRSKKKDNVAKVGGDFSPIATGPAARSYREEGFEREGGRMAMSQDYKQRLLTVDFSKVLQDAKAEPYMIGGQTQGFKLTRIREGSIYQKAGLQNDDVVEEINGVRLTNAPAAIRLLQSLRNETNIEVIVNRGGQRVPLELSVK
jgi:general secretion pathway protein C